MYVIKRTKTATLQNALPPGQSGGEGPTTTAVHWAATVAPEGNVTSWSAEQSAAVVVSEQVAKKVRAFHHNLANSGKVEVIPASPEKAKEVEESAATIKRLEAELAASKEAQKSMEAELKRQVEQKKTREHKAGESK